jgi:DNA-binding NtrC family response regulator
MKRQSVCFSARSYLVRATSVWKQGAYDNITKPFDLDEVNLSVDRALGKERLELEERIVQQLLTGIV